MADKSVSVPPAKRKRVTKTFKAATTLSIDVSVKPFLNTYGKITFKVNSQSDKSKIYQIEHKVFGASDTPRLICDCGQQFGRGDRDHCKHIAAVILFQMVQLSFASNDSKTTASPPLSAFDETTLINMFKDLGAKVGGQTTFFKAAKFKYEKKVSKKVFKSALPAPSVSSKPFAPSFSSLPPSTFGEMISPAMPSHPAFSVPNPFVSSNDTSGDSLLASADVDLSADPPADAAKPKGVFSSLRKLPRRSDKKMRN